MLKKNCPHMQILVLARDCTQLLQAAAHTSECWYFCSSLLLLTCEAEFNSCLYLWNIIGCVWKTIFEAYLHVNGKLLMF